MENIKVKDGELWDKIPNSNNYYISSFGRVYCKTLKYPKGRLREVNDFTKDKDGYYTMSFRNLKRNRETVPIHRLVAKVFIPNTDKNKTCVNHIDSNRLNNNISNLEWVTPKENVHHSYLHGQRKKCLEVPRVAKITLYQKSQIPFLRQYYSLKKIAELYNISYTSIKNIVNKLKISQDNQQPSIYSNYK